MSRSSSRSRRSTSARVADARQRQAARDRIVHGGLEGDVGAAEGLFRHGQRNRPAERRLPVLQGAAQVEVVDYLLDQIRGVLKERGPRRGTTRHPHRRQDELTEPMRRGDRGLVERRDCVAPILSRRVATSSLVPVAISTATSSSAGTATSSVRRRSRWACTATSRSRTRSRNSPVAMRVKVTARISDSSTPSATKRATNARDGEGLPRASGGLEHRHPSSGQWTADVEGRW